MLPTLELELNGIFFQNRGLIGTLGQEETVCCDKEKSETLKICKGGGGGGGGGGMVRLLCDSGFGT